MSEKHFADSIPTCCYAVVFSSLRPMPVDADNQPNDGYEEMAERMVELARAQPGFLGIESVRQPDGFGISVSYWKDLQSIRDWRAHAEHLVAQQQGKERWYDGYRLRIAHVERVIEWDRSV